MSVRVSYFARDGRKVASTQQVVAIGQFDGFHIGHQALLNQVIQLSGERHLHSAILTFSPPPKVYFEQVSLDERLMTEEDKIQYCLDYGLAGVFIIDFNQTVAELTPEQFVKQVLIAQCRAEIVLVGEDFRFGHQRRGDVKLMRELLAEYDKKLVMVEEVEINHRKVGSSWCRQLLIEKDFAQLEQLLGRSWSMSETFSNCRTEAGVEAIVTHRLLPIVSNKNVKIYAHGKWLMALVSIELVAVGVYRIILHSINSEGEVMIVFDEKAI